MNSLQFRLFFLSGFSGLVYQIVWLRLAFAAFGVITPVISVVLSVFMLGLGAGAWLAGSVLRQQTWSKMAALRGYATAEFLIGIGGLAVPWLFVQGEKLLLPVGQTDSVSYMVLSAGIILVAMVPFCLCMGTTFPFMMAAIRGDRGSADGFSYLYLANVLGALTGTLLTPLVLVELCGFRGTLLIGLIANWTAAVLAFRAGGSRFVVAGTAEPEPPTIHVTKTAIAEINTTSREGALYLTVLFTTGLTSMGMEVVWTRAFTPVLRTQVYSFAGLLFAYLLATWCGSALYRWQLARKRVVSNTFLLSLLSLAATGQLLAADPRIELPRYELQVVWLLLGIAPYCSILGYLTPKLIDEYSAGSADVVGHAYAVNVFGCIIGPLLVSYVLLPKLGLHWSGIVLALPLCVLATWSLQQKVNESIASNQFVKWIWPAALLCAIVAATLGTSYEDRFIATGAKVLRDHTATVIATEIDGHKQLLVNGTPITVITTNTKLMAHLPLAQLPHEPNSALVICFGMGTTYRSLLSWGIDVTAVELVPSVAESFGYFFPDAEQVRQDPHGHIIIDDGRRYLRRTTERFDVITLDPPPPVEAAGSSLLYSREFYQLIKPRLADGGILQQWYPGGDLSTFLAILRAASLEFPHLRVMRAQDGWGYHILCSLEPLPQRSADELFARMPAAAQRDLVEWLPDQTGPALLRAVINTPVEWKQVLQRSPSAIITDDRPFNEYYVLRHLWELWTETYSIVQ